MKVQLYFRDLNVPTEVLDLGLVEGEHAKRLGIFDRVLVRGNQFFEYSHTTLENTMAVFYEVKGRIICPHCSSTCAVEPTMRQDDRDAAKTTSGKYKAMLFAPFIHVEDTTPEKCLGKLQKLRPELKRLTYRPIDGTIYNGTFGPVGVVFWKMDQ